MLEFKLVAALATLMPICVIALLFTLGTHRFGLRMIGWCIVGAQVAVQIAMIGSPLYQSYRWQSRIADAENTTDVAHLLSMPGAFQQFLNFCAKEFCSENPLYYQPPSYMIISNDMLVVPAQVLAAC